MSIFTRIFKIGQASANKALDNMENPELMLDQAIRDKDAQIRDARKAIQSVIATERQTKALLEKEKAAKFTWEQKAEAALKASREDLAVKALQRAAEHEQKAAGLQDNWQSQRDSVESLKKDILQMDDQIAEYRRNKDFIVAQSKAADVKKKIYEAKARISGRHSADDLMARMKAKAERTSYEADAAQEMAESLSEGDTLDREFEDLSSTGVSTEVQSKLDALKAKFGQSATD